MNKKKIISRETAESLIALARTGRVKIVKEYVDGNPEFFAYSRSGPLIGQIGNKYKYLFQILLSETGANDGLLDGFSQTTRVPK